jgi:serine/threonine protein kinase
MSSHEDLCLAPLSALTWPGHAPPRRLEIPEDTDPNLKDLLVRMLDKNPETRITVPEIAVCLRPAAATLL